MVHVRTIRLGDYCRPISGVHVTARGLNFGTTTRHIDQRAKCDEPGAISFLVIAIARIKNGVLADEEGSALGDPLNISMSKELLALLGISSASLVGSALIGSTKKSKQPNENAVRATAKELVRTQNLPDSLTFLASRIRSPEDRVVETNHVAEEIEQNAVGTLYKNPSAHDASFTDMFEGDEIGNAAHVDLAKVQMFFFTIVVAIAYVAALWEVLAEHGIYDASFSFPSVSDTMIGLLGISNASYLTAKGINHT